jgi:hypothetical protein
MLITCPLLQGLTRKATELSFVFLFFLRQFATLVGFANVGSRDRVPYEPVCGV